MQSYEYKVVPAPDRGKRGKGAKGFAGRFANALSIILNEQAADGWEYVRAESLPSTDRTGLTRKKVESFQNVLVFRRATASPSLPVVPAMAPIEERQEPRLTEDKVQSEMAETEEIEEAGSENAEEAEPESLDQDLEDIVEELEVEEEAAEEKPKAKKKPRRKPSKPKS